MHPAKLLACNTCQGKQTGPALSVLFAKQDHCCESDEDVNVGLLSGRSD